MKIALVCPFNMLTRPGGVPQVVHHLYEGLKKNGHTVRIITQRPTGFKGDPPEDYVLFGRVRTFKGGFGTEGNWGMPSDGDEIKEYLSKEKFDVINCHEPWIPWLAWQVVRNSDSVYVATFHANLIDTAAGKAWTAKVFHPIGRPFIEKMHLLTATSTASAGMIKSLANIKLARDRAMIENLQYTPCGVELNVYKPFKKKVPLSGPNTKTIVYIGRMEKRKGVDWLLKAFAELQKDMPDIHLVMAGAGLWLNKLKQYAQSEKIKNVSFPGYVTDEEKHRLLGNADLACFASPYGEGQGIVLLEAMAMGIPILAGNNSGYAATMNGHGRIALVDPESTKDFANRMAVFLTDNELRKSMISWGLNEVKKYDYPKVVRRYEEAYKTAIEMKNNSKSAAERDNEKKQRKTIHRFFVRRHAG